MYVIIQLYSILVTLKKILLNINKKLYSPCMYVCVAQVILFGISCNKKLIAQTYK